jgi:hypothetical protein
MDHPANPNHPVAFHVRADGWMGASFNFEKPRTLNPGETLRLRYGLFVHSGAADPPAIDHTWRSFSQPTLEALKDRK